MKGEIRPHVRNWLTVIAHEKTITLQMNMIIGAPEYEIAQVKDKNDLEWPVGITMKPQVIIVLLEGRTEGQQRGLTVEKVLVRTTMKMTQTLTMMTR